MYSVLMVFLVTIMARGYTTEQLCPDPHLVAPCTCFKDTVSSRWTALCQNISEASDISDVFEKNPNWNLQDVHVDGCTMSYVPANMLERARFQNLNVSNSVLDTLFDVPAARTPELNLYLHNLRLLRGFEWNLFSNSNFKDFAAFNTEIPSFGSSFRESMSHDVDRIYFEGTKTRRIAEGAFENLKNLQILAIRISMLKALSRNMFPKPWEKILYLDFSFNQITALPEDIFDDMPNLGAFLFERNLLTTVSEKIFSRRALFTFINNPLNCICNMKWLTTSNKIDLTNFKGTCDEPDNMKGKALEKLTEDDFSYCT